MRKICVLVSCLFLIVAALGQQTKPLTCTGRVVDFKAQPVSGAEVTCYEQFYDYGEGAIRWKVLGQAKTNATGRFSLELKVTDKEHVWAVARKQGLSLGWAQAAHEFGDLELMIRLGKPSVLAGTVVDEAGEPITGAEVRANLCRNKRTTTSGDEQEWLPGIAPIDWRRTKSNDQGRFQFDNIPENSHVDLLVTAVGKASVYTYQVGPARRFEGGAGPRFKAGRRGIEVILPSEARIEGRAVDTDSGKGVGGLTLAVAPHFSPAFFDRFSCISKEDGTFSIGGLQSGEYLISGDFPSIDVDVESGRSTDVLIGLNPQRIVMPRQKTTGESVSNATIQISLKILMVPEDVETGAFKRDKSLSSGLFVRNGQEYADRLLRWSQDTKGTKLISSPQVMINDGQEANISLRKMMTYIAGFESARDGTGKLIAQNKSLLVGDEYKIRGVLKSSDRIHVKLNAKRQSPIFETRQHQKGYDYQIPLPAAYFSTDVIARNNEPVVISCLRCGKPPLYLVMTTSWWSPLGEPHSLIGKLLPKPDNIRNIGTEFDLKQAEGKLMLICFWDMQQRPSRHCIRQLAEKANNLADKGVIIVAVQASKIDENTLSEWVKKYNIPFPVGMVQGDEEKKRFTWGVRSLPWLILTDRKHIVRAEGFGLDELSEKTEEAGNAK